MPNVQHDSHPKGKVINCGSTVMLCIHLVLLPITSPGCFITNHFHFSVNFHSYYIFHYLHGTCWISDGQENNCFQEACKVHYQVCKGLPLNIILSHLSPVHTFTSYFPNTYFNIFLPSVSRPCKLTLSWRFCKKYFVFIFPFPYA